MKRSWMRSCAKAFAFGALWILGCAPLPKTGLIRAVLDSHPAISVQIGQMAKVPDLTKRVTNRKPNPEGKILILEYHKLSAKNGLLDRTPAKFKSDLKRLYELGYRPVTVTEWQDKRMPLPPGASPVIMTFDDAQDSQLRFKKDGSLDSNCFVGIWKQFAVEHPDFPVHATFFILPKYPFGQTSHVKDKIKMLQEMGSEIGSHTYHHPNLAICSDDAVKAEIADSLDWLEKEFGVTNVPLAFPYGNKPRHMDIVKGFEWNGKEYHVRCCLLAAGQPAEPLTSKKYNPWIIPRVVVCEREGGSTYWLRVMQTGKKFAPYVAS